MKTTILDVGGMLAVLDYRAVERQLRRVPGIHLVTTNFATGMATIEYDEAITNVEALRAKIIDCGFHCRGEALPKHICEPHLGHADGLDTHAGHGATTKFVDSKPRAPVAHEHHVHSVPAPARTLAGAPAMPMSHDMAHEMGHGAGMDMQAMVRDMRNRFWISLVFTIPIFLFSPMGFESIRVKPPFGLDLNLVLFFLASAAILYPVWPFVVAALRALRNGILNMAVLVILSVGTGYLFSVGATFFFKGEQFYEAAAILLVFILLGHWLEMRARAGASEAIRALMGMSPVSGR